MGIFAQRREKVTEAIPIVKPPQKKGKYQLN